MKIPRVGESSKEEIMEYLFQDFDYGTQVIDLTASTLSLQDMEHGARQVMERYGLPQQHVKPSTMSDEHYWELFNKGIETFCNWIDKHGLL